jgi:hypothetical protein
MTFRSSHLSRGAIAAALAAVVCLAAPAAGANAQAPDTTIDSGPPPTNDDTPEFAFSSPDTPMATFECMHHRTNTSAPAFTACTPPLTLPPLANGEWTFAVRAVDAGVADPTPATSVFTVEAPIPDTTITSPPLGLTNNRTPQIAFISTEAGNFECSHHRPGEAAAFTPCSSPHTLPSLADGIWVFEVAAIDAAGNHDPTSATDTFTLDATAPDTSIVSGPAGLSNDATPDFAFASTEPGSAGCRLHRIGEAAPPFAACSSPHVAGPLSDGAYVFEVMAVDAAGNADASPARTSFEIDTTPPQTTITGGPGDTTAATAVFLFSAPGAQRFSCRLDGGAWQACDSPVTYQSLSLGPHRFEVAAVDAAGNEDPTPAGHAWQVLRPGLVIPGAVQQATALAKELVQMRRALGRVRLRTLARRRTLLFKTYDALTAGTVEVRARARVRKGGRRRWIGVIAGKREVPGAGRHRVRARVTKKGRGLARSRRKLPLELRLSFTDLAGRSLWATSTVTLRR